MEFFGLGNAAELESPLGQLVKSATDPLLLGPDWAKNLEICDSISSAPEAAAVIKAVHHQLKNSDPKVVQLALTLVDTCVQNSWTHVPQAINKSFMDEMGQICRGRRGVQNQEEALRLVQLWGRRFEAKRSELPLFFDTYMAMRAQGANFPREESPPPPSTNTSSSTKKSKNDSNSAVSEPPAEIDPNAKVTADLNVVLEQVRLCREMLPESVGIAGDDLLAEVVGFLEACQERMLELVEAGTNGLLSEEVFEQCLRVNDAITKTLEAEKDGLTIAVDDGTQPIGEVSKKSSGDSSSGLTTSLLDEEVDEFAALTMKTSTKKASGSKKIPTIRGPGSNPSKAKSGGANLVVPPPGSSSTSQPVPQQHQQQQKSQQAVDLDFLGGGSTSASTSTGTNGSSSQLPPPPAAVSNNPFDLEEEPPASQNKPIPTLLPPPPQQQAPPPARVSSSTNPILARTSTGDDLLDIFSNSPNPNPQNQQTQEKKAATLGSTEMTDEEFESFLNK
eukprot:CAMPEP_0114426920 /NCGR_PEP_ID=MMETSP0103-20121206/8063_1 /TAXON_ID=37642 ORGANISM="Paraphysomonas imperforata, Strain PA2" /NCGR_SAMPLE_ID=MMETSP0103 /ASSEMBLY_ACC=CAM_ASM_000201 /LENGTH=503 /DNA_ID=CAMNT_0001595929 /DNA_START=151 /DNA_END=1662 /DNA_ORIENTATION=-